MVQPHPPLAPCDRARPRPHLATRHPSCHPAVYVYATARRELDMARVPHQRGRLRGRCAGEGGLTDRRCRHAKGARHRPAAYQPVTQPAAWIQGSSMICNSHPQNREYTLTLDQTNLKPAARLPEKPLDSCQSSWQPWQTRQRGRSRSRLPSRRVGGGPSSTSRSRARCVPRQPPAAAAATGPCRLLAVCPARADHSPAKSAHLPAPVRRICGGTRMLALASRCAAFAARGPLRA
eukprot:COSAG01_NODE_12598_length_1712_cov_28.298202_1_plen_234_part_10